MNTLELAGANSEVATPDPLEQEIAELILVTLNLDHLTLADLPPHEPLFGEGLGLDSVDALELAMVLQKRYGIRIETNVKDSRKHFATVASLAAFVTQQRSACAD